MGFQPQADPPLRVTAYTGYAWESSLAMLRLVGPAQLSGIHLIRGVEENQVYPERVSAGDLVVVQREFPRHVQMYRAIVERARREHKPLVLDLDDLLFELPEDHPDRLTHHYADALFPLAQAILEADAIIASSTSLRDYLLELNPATCLLPNYLDERVWVLREPPAPASEKFPVIIGYMGGGSHGPDMAMIVPALARILERYAGRVQMRMYGLKPDERLAHLPGVEWVAQTEYNYVRFATSFSAEQCDIFIAPLRDNLFNRCKSSIKFLEYSASATPGVYSRLPPYESLVVHGENGFLASDLQEWEEGLARLIEAPGLRVEMGRRAQETVKQNWLLSRHAGEWVEAFRQILARQGASMSEHSWRASGLPALLLRLGDQVSAAHAAQLAEKENAFQSLLEKHARVEHEYELIRKRLNELESSRAWKMAQGIRRLRLSLLPTGSRRERLAKKASGFVRKLSRRPVTNDR